MPGTYNVVRQLAAALVLTVLVCRTQRGPGAKCIASLLCNSTSGVDYGARYQVMWRRKTQGADNELCAGFDSVFCRKPRSSSPRTRAPLRQAGAQYYLHNVYGVILPADNGAYITKTGGMLLGNVASHMQDSRRICSTNRGEKIVVTSQDLQTIFTVPLDGEQNAGIRATKAKRIAQCSHHACFGQWRARAAHELHRRLNGIV